MVKQLPVLEEGCFNQPFQRKSLFLSAGICLFFAVSTRRGFLVSPWLPWLFLIRSPLCLIEKSDTLNQRRRCWRKAQEAFWLSKQAAAIWPNRCKLNVTKFRSGKRGEKKKKPVYFSQMYDSPLCYPSFLPLPLLEITSRKLKMVSYQSYLSVKR